jgi:uncharacterized protein YecE (DUF72 family)
MYKWQLPPSFKKKNHAVPKYVEILRKEKKNVIAVREITACNFSCILV